MRRVSVLLPCLAALVGCPMTAAGPDGYFPLTRSDAAGSSPGASTAMRLVAPLSTARVTSRRPTLRWLLPPDATGARIEVFRDAAMTVPVTTFDAQGTSARPASDLPTGMLFWRATALQNGAPTAAVSPRWEMRVRVHSAPVDTSWGSAPDFNGDGRVDLLVGSHLAPSALRPIPVSSIGPDALAPPILPPGNVGSLGAPGATAVGDLNGDGYVDVITTHTVTAPASRTLRVFSGSITGALPTPLATVQAPSAYAGTFGERLAAVGDVDGDGLGDVVESAPGHVAVYLGAPDGLSPTPSLSLTGTAGFGRNVAAAGDLDGDGHADFAVARGLAGESANHEVRVYFGAPGALAGPVVLTADTSTSEFGVAMASAGDVNGDGYADLLVGAPGGARVFVYPGGETGIATTPSATLQGPVGSRFGALVAAAGDVNGDGYDDVYVGVPGSSEVRVYTGSVAGLATTAARTYSDPQYTALGTTAADLADPDNDNCDDGVVSSLGDNVAVVLHHTPGAMTVSHVVSMGSGGPLATTVVGASP